MKKQHTLRATMLGCIMALTTSVAAQRGVDVNPIALELKLGVTTPLSSYPSMDNGTGGLVAVEVRANLKAVPVDIGLEALRGYAHRTLSDTKGDADFNVTDYSLFADYNFNRGGTLAPFAGLGIGLARCDSPISDTHKAMVTPRVGIEAWHHLRLTLDCRLGAKYHNYLGLSVGYAFGGGPSNK